MELNGWSVSAQHLLNLFEKTIELLRTCYLGWCCFLGSHYQFLHSTITIHLSENPPKATFRALRMRAGLVKATNGFHNDMKCFETADDWSSWRLDNHTRCLFPLVNRGSVDEKTSWRTKPIAMACAAPRKYSHKCSPHFRLQPVVHPNESNPTKRTNSDDMLFR